MLGGRVEDKSGLSSRNTLDVVEDVFSRWFHGAPFHSLCRGNFCEWLAWAFYDEVTENLSEKELEELNLLADFGEELIGYKFPPGYNCDVTSIRLTKDPIFSIHRPLIYYIVIGMMQYVGDFTLFWMGFQKQKISGQSFYVRNPIGNPTSKNQVGQITKPIVFIHGIGAGLVIYLSFIKRCFPISSPLYLLEWPHVSMTFGAEEVPSEKQTIEAIRALMYQNGHSEAVFVGHSLGTAAISWLLRSEENQEFEEATSELSSKKNTAMANPLSPLNTTHSLRTLPSLVSSVVLIDPIVFLLSDPSVVFNFIHRTPTCSVELMMYYFVSRELYIANTLSRQFSWSHTILFEEDLPVQNLTFSGKKRAKMLFFYQGQMQ